MYKKDIDFILNTKHDNQLLLINQLMEKLINEKTDDEKIEEILGEIFAELIIQEENKNLYYFKPREKANDFVKKYKKYIFSKRMCSILYSKLVDVNRYNKDVDLLTRVNNKKFGLHSLLFALFNDNKFVSSVDLLNYYTDEIMGYDVTSDNEKWFFNHNIEGLMVGPDEFDGLNNGIIEEIIHLFTYPDMVKKDIQEGVHIEFQKEFSKILDIIEQNDVIPDRYLLFAIVFILNLHTILFYHRSKFSITADEDTKNIITLFGINNIKRIIKIGSEMNVKIINIWENLLNYVQKNNLLDNTSHPIDLLCVSDAHLLSQAQSRLFGLSNIKHVYHDQYVTKCRKKLIEATIFLNHNAYVRHVRNIDDENIPRYPLNSIKYKYSLFAIEELISDNTELISDIILQDEKLLKNIREMLIKYIKMVFQISHTTRLSKFYSNIFNRQYLLICDFVSRDLFKKLQKSPDILLLIISEDDVDSFISIMEEYSDVNFDFLEISKKEAINALENIINKNNNNKIIQLIKHILSYLKLKEIFI